MVTIPQEEFESMLERAAERGARHALHEVGLDGEDAAHDIRDPALFMSMIDCFRIDRAIDIFLNALYSLEDQVRRKIGELLDATIADDGGVVVLAVTQQTDFNDRIGQTEAYRYRGGRTPRQYSHQQDRPATEFDSSVCN
ncbi:MAG TPA: DUF6127 family protein [Rhodocyclaceae bacterium]|nr:DUF6127 family protein [Rhodocyclaceae bacterium]HNL20745.1 DUF6127 family protein [Rhodocyclaceae bacterium]